MGTVDRSVGTLAKVDLDRALAEILRVASHEIRQPVAVVLALAEAARVVPDASDRVRWYLDRIIDEAVTLAEVARSVLVPEGDMVHVGEEPTEVVGLVEDVLATFELTWTGALSRSGDLEGYLLGDPVLLRRAIVNLVDNATRAAGPDGRVAVDVRRVGERLVLSVEDDGPGFGYIESQSHIGLAVARRVFAEAGGTLTVAVSRELGGAAVRFSVPALDDPYLKEADAS